MAVLRIPALQFRLWCGVPIQVSPFWEQSYWPPVICRKKLPEIAGKISAASEASDALELHKLRKLLRESEKHQKDIAAELCGIPAEPCGDLRGLGCNSLSGCF